MSSRYPNIGYGKHQDPNLSQQGSDEQYKTQFHHHSPLSILFYKQTNEQTASFKIIRLIYDHHLHHQWSGLNNNNNNNNNNSNLVQQKNIENKAVFFSTSLLFVHNTNDC
ncbi:unnamed protein product [Schistosoma curassoni]|uniref:Uncharacterized protein n=1 Tax=Schistosoma curassoni TaxID=6186 RepID=A0A183K361_9TREM|nr:unnamed protein product [Schistosoma curassoni]